jgi:hypothetical protein
MAALHRPSRFYYTALSDYFDVGSGLDFVQNADSREPNS